MTSGGLELVEGEYTLETVVAGAGEGDADGHGNASKGWFHRARHRRDAAARDRGRGTGSRPRRPAGAARCRPACQRPHQPDDPGHTRGLRGHGHPSRPARRGDPGHPVLVGGAGPSAHQWPGQPWCQWATGTRATIVVAKSDSERRLERTARPTHPATRPDPESPEGDLTIRQAEGNDLNAVSRSGTARGRSSTNPSRASTTSRWVWPSGGPLMSSPPRSGAGRRSWPRWPVTSSGWSPSARRRALRRLEALRPARTPRKGIGSRLMEAVVERRSRLRPHADHGGLPGWQQLRRAVPPRPWLRRVPPRALGLRAAGHDLDGARAGPADGVSEGAAGEAT